MSPFLVLYVVDPLERAGRTFVQQFAVLLLVSGSAGLLVTQNWVLALDSAGFAALVSLLTSVLTFKLSAQSVLVDLGLRVVKTFLQSFLGTLTATNVLSVAHADWKGALAVAVPVALTALVTGIAALGIPGTHGASLLPAGLVPAVETDYQPGAVTDPSVELDEAGNAVTGSDQVTV
jgi:hypothetical protein